MRIPRNLEKSKTYKKLLKNEIESQEELESLVKELSNTYIDSSIYRSYRNSEIRKRIKNSYSRITARNIKAEYTINSIRITFRNLKSDELNAKHSVEFKHEHGSIIATCDCKDFEKRCKQLSIPCKHIIFAERVMRCEARKHAKALFLVLSHYKR